MTSIASPSSYLLLLALCALAFTQSTYALEDGQADPSFVAPVFFNNDISDVKVNVLSVAPNGQVLFAGNFDRLNDTVRQSIARLNADGTLDMTFAPTVNGEINAILVLASGKIMLGGEFTQVNNSAANNVVRLNANGTVDSSFNLSADAAVNVIFERRSGDLLIGGDFEQIGDQAKSVLVQVSDSGTVDQSFTAGPFYVPAFNSAPTIADIEEIHGDTSNDDKLIVTGGRFREQDEDDSWVGIIQLNNDGSIDESFSFDMGDWSFRGIGDAIVREANGDIVIGGGFGVTQEGEDSRLAIAKFTSSGSYIETYNPILNASISDMVLLSNGELAVVGQSLIDTNSSIRSGLIVLDSDGDISENVAPLGLSNTTKIELQPSGNIVVGGGISGIWDGTTLQDRSAIARISSTGSLLSNPAFDILVAGGRLDSIVSDRRGNIYVGGEFAEVDAQAQPWIVKVLGDGSVDTAFTLALSSPVKAMLRLRSGDILIEQGNLIKIDSNGVIDPSFNTISGGSSITKILELESGQILVAGGFDPDGVEGDRKYLVRLNADGSVDDTFQSGFSTFVSDFDVDSAGNIYAIGGFLFVDGNARSGFAKLNPDGSLVTTFNVLLEDQIGNPGGQTVAVLPDQSVVIGGSFVQVESQSRRYIARISPNGSFDSSYAPELGSYAIIVNGTMLPQTSELIPLPDGRLIVAGSLGGTASAYRFLLRLNEDGSIDQIFEDGQLDYHVSAAHLQDDGKLLVAGGFTQVGDHLSGSIARIETGLDFDDLCFPLITETGSVANICL